MPVGDAERAFQDAAAADGIELERARLPWVNRRGHFHLPEAAAAAREPLQVIFDALGGIRADQAAKGTQSLPGDFIHQPTGTLIEIDEFQHFTSFRRQALMLYPSDTPLGYSLTRYLELCDEWSPRADRYRHGRRAVGFGPSGRPRQRAYNDSLRDITAPAMGRPPIVRVPVLDGDGAAAYSAVRDRLGQLVSTESPVRRR